jgi:Putative beta-barrel porin-2, OmpL-like. bbp2
LAIDPQFKNVFGEAIGLIVAFASFTFQNRLLWMLIPIRSQVQSRTRRTRFSFRFKLGEEARTIFFVIFVASSSLVHAQANSPKTDSTSAVIPPKASLTDSIYLEPYFAYDLNNPFSKNIPYLVNYSRHDEFNLNLAVFYASYQDSNVRGTLGLQSGTFPMAAYAAEPAILQYLYQANAGVQLLPNLWIDAGVLPSHFGIENAIGKEQWALTRSLVAENTPYYETGVRAGYTTGPWTFDLFALNGWQNIQDVNSNKALGTEIEYSAGILTLNSSTFFGNTHPDSTPRTRIFHDFYAIVAVSSILSISGVYDIGWEQTSPKEPYAYWEGADIIARFLLSNKFALALRGEYFNDPEQVLLVTGTPNGYQTAGYSLNFDYMVSPLATIRIEAKRYIATDAIFTQNETAVNGSTILTSSLAVLF